MIIWLTSHTALVIQEPYNVLDRQNYGIQFLFLQWNRNLVFIATIISFLYNVIRNSITTDFFDVTISRRSNINPKVYS